MHTKQSTVLVLIMFGLVVSLTVTSTLASTDVTISDLIEIEIKNYEGKDLSSIDAFRENSIEGPQYIDNETYQLTITGLVDNKKQYTINQVISKHEILRKVVTLYCVEGWKATILWEGVLIKDILEEAKVDPQATNIIFYAYDGYSTSLPLDYVINNNIMMAYKMNNVTLPPERGYPFQLVAESKWGYKWIKWITTIEVSNDNTYKGYWESRGFANDAALDEPFYGEYGGNYGDFVDAGDIIPEFPSQIILPLFVMAAMFTIMFRKKILNKLNIS